MIAPWLQTALDRALALPAHAVLLHGPGALGQFELAQALAAAWLCEAPAATRHACGQCTGCRLMAQRTHPDARTLVPDALRERLGWGGAADEEGEAGEVKSKAKPSRDIKVAAVREAIDWGQRTASRAGAKAIVIHPSEALNETAANALLKTLEEPPGRLRLVLTAEDPEALLATVRSRCQRIAIAPPTHDAASAWLAGQGAAPAQALLGAAGGLPHAALALLADGVDAAAWQRVPALARAGQADPLLRWPVARVVEALHKLCADLMAAQAGGAPRWFDAAALAPSRHGSPPALAALVAWQADLRLAARHDEHPWHASLRIEALLARAAQAWQTARPASSAPGRPLDTLPGQ